MSYNTLCCYRITVDNNSQSQDFNTYKLLLHCLITHKPFHQLVDIPFTLPFQRTQVDLLEFTLPQTHDKAYFQIDPCHLW